MGSALAGIPLVAIPGMIFAQPDSAGPLDLDMVNEFVGAAHNNLAKTKKMLAKVPALARASWDWGQGDWETGLGGASHTGSPDIARYLLNNGARMDLFAAAVLGELEIVKAVVTAFPGALDVPGPHGIPLIEHALAGGKGAKPVADYLSSLGEKKRESEHKDLPLTEEEMAWFLGIYDADHRKGLSLEVTLKDGRLHGQPTGSPQLPLHYQGDGEFWAPDAEATLSFTPVGGRAMKVQLAQFSSKVTATRRKE